MPVCLLKTNFLRGKTLVLSKFEYPAWKEWKFSGNWFGSCHMISSPHCSPPVTTDTYPEHLKPISGSGRKNSSCSVQDISTELQQQEKFSLYRSTAYLLPTTLVLGRAQKWFFEDAIKPTLLHGIASPKVKSLRVSRNSRDAPWLSWYWQVFIYLADYKMEWFRLLISST